MASGNYEPPDLASVLRTLATYAPPKPSQAAAFASITGTQHEEELEEGEYEPPDISHQASQQPVQIAPPAQFIHPSNQPCPVLSHLNESFPLTATDRKAPRTDPAAITDWSTALKCVMKTIAQSEAIIARIRKMIISQHEHERTWWAGREEIIHKHEGRVERKRKLDDMIRSVGGKVPASTPVTSPEEDAAELARYEKKVHRAAREMVDASTRDLKTMGIPFFGTKQNLIREAPDEEANIGLQYPDNKGRAENIISSDELLNLQRRMLETLEDLSRE